MSPEPSEAPEADRRIRAFNRERFKEEASAALSALMEREGVSRADLARRLSRSRPFISKILDAQHNFTLETLADVALSLGYAMHFAISAEPMRFRMPEIHLGDEGEPALEPYSFEQYTSVSDIDFDSESVPAVRTAAWASESAPARITA